MYSCCRPRRAQGSFYRGSAYGGVCVISQIDELMNPEAGYLVKEGLVLCVEVLECCPWFEFADLEKYASEDEAGASLSDSEESASGSDASECSSSVPDAAEPFWTMMGRTSLGTGCGSAPFLSVCTLQTFHLHFPSTCMAVPCFRWSARLARACFI